MIISVASGKGGTGKTTIATSLAVVLGSGAQLVDCDVEEPNCHILMKPVLETSDSITIPTPVVEVEKCTLCGKCGEVCRFSAIVVIGDQALTFPEMCHGCGGCSLLCPEKAIREGSRELGVRESGFAGSTEFVHGSLRVGEAMSPPLIRAVKEKINPSKVAILDAPPGASCPVIHTVMGSDFVILVTEPTLSGLHDMKRAMQLARGFRIPVAVIINKYDINADVTEQIEDFSDKANAPILGKIPYDPEVIRAMVQRRCIVENGNSPANAAIRKIWERQESALLS
jgi:MinD superfamily P-loop ATPase